MEEKQLIQIPEQKESLKLSKMSKGYNWEIKIFITNEDKDAVERIKRLDEDLRQIYSEDEED